MADTNKLLLSFKLNGGSDEVRVSLAEYKGSRGLDIRKYYETQDGGFAPTREGVRIKSAPDLELLIGTLIDSKDAILDFIAEEEG